MKPNWMGPRATMRTQSNTEMEPSRSIWAEEPMILDCLEPILYQLPVCKNGLLMSSDSSLELEVIASFVLPPTRPCRNEMSHRKQIQNHPLLELSNDAWWGLGKVGGPRRRLTSDNVCRLVALDIDNLNIGLIRVLRVAEDNDIISTWNLFFVWISQL